METPTKSRTVTPSVATIRRLRLERGWRVEDLARKAKCSVKTIENVERGQNVYVFTLTKLADALGVSYVTLVAGNEPPPLPPTLTSRSRFEVEIKVAVPYENFDECDQLVGFVELLKRLLERAGDVQVKAVREGSVVIVLEVNDDDIPGLFKQFMDGELRKFGVESMSIVERNLNPQDTWIAMSDINELKRQMDRLNSEEGTNPKTG